MERSQNACVVCCTAGWLPYAASTILSCVQSDPEHQPDFHVLCLSDNTADAEAFTAFMRAKGISPILHLASVPSELTALDTGRLSSATLLRLCLHRVISPHYKRVLYLDCDVLALGRATEIFACDLGGKPMGAVEDYITKHAPPNIRRDYLSHLGLGLEGKYFNSGVMLFDWPQTISSLLLPSALDHIIESHRENRVLPLVDQDALNIAFRGQWAELPLQFNTTDIDYSRGRPVVFRHYSTKFKPWQSAWAPGFSDAKAKYRSLLSGSPWPDAVASFNKIWVRETFYSLLRKATRAAFPSS